MVKMEEMIMAKIVDCPFCGQEVTKGIFSGDDCELDVGTFKALTCCPKCYKKYKGKVKENKERFLTKFENMKKATKSKYTEKDIAKLYEIYVEEKAKQSEKCGGQQLDKMGGFFTYNANGFFNVSEYGKGFGKGDATDDSKASCFDKNDITKIEYAKAGSGKFDGLFHKIYCFAIRLNDETVMTFKPSVTSTVESGAGFMFGYQKSAEKKLAYQLEEFKRLIGSDLPIVKVNKI